MAQITPGNNAASIPPDVSAGISDNKEVRDWMCKLSLSMSSALGYISTLGRETYETLIQMGQAGSPSDILQGEIRDHRSRLFGAKYVIICAKGPHC